MIAWALSGHPVYFALLYFFPQYVPQPRAYLLGSLVAFAMLFVITFVGVIVYIKHERITLLTLPLTPLLVVLNTFGALWDGLRPFRRSL